MKEPLVSKKRIKYMLVIMLTFILCASVVTVFAADGEMSGTGTEQSENTETEEPDQADSSGLKEEESGQTSAQARDEKKPEQTPAPARDEKKQEQTDDSEESEQSKETVVVKAAPALGATKGTTIEYGSKAIAQSRQFWSKDGKYIGCCCQAGAQPDASGTATMSKVANTTLVAKIAYYYGYKNNWIHNYAVISGFQQHTNAARFMYMVQMSQQGTAAWKKWATDSSFGQRVKDDAVARFADAQKLSVTVPDNFECYICSPTNGHQKFILFRYNTVVAPGTVTLQKVSGNADITG